MNWDHFSLSIKISLIMFQVQFRIFTLPLLLSARILKILHVLFPFLKFIFKFVHMVKSLQWKIVTEISEMSSLQNVKMNYMKPIHPVLFIYTEKYLHTFLQAFQTLKNYDTSLIFFKVLNVKNIFSVFRS